MVTSFRPVIPLKLTWSFFLVVEHTVSDSLLLTQPVSSPGREIGEGRQVFHRGEGSNPHWSVSATQGATMHNQDRVLRFWIF